MLDYCGPIIASSAQALTRSLSEENIAKIVNNCELFDDVELGADVDSLTRNMIGGFNMEGGCDLDSLQFRMGSKTIITQITSPMKIRTASLHSH